MTFNKTALSDTFNLSKLYIMIQKKIEEMTTEVVIYISLQVYLSLNNPHVQLFDSFLN